MKIAVGKFALCLVAFVVVVFLRLAVAQDLQLSESERQQLLSAKMRTVQHIALNPVVVRAVRRQNADGLTADLIAKRDDEWQTSGQDDEFKRSLEENTAGRLLRDVVSRNESVNEAFVADAQGANVAAFPPTSDYYQGDEEKWTQSFNGGQGRVHLEPLQFDESSGVAAVQISAPVIDKGLTIGVLTVGVTVDYIEAKQVGASTQ